jgi:broad-specificity NMP kinase
MSVIQSGTKYSFANITDTFQTLPKGNYLLKFDQREGYFLEKKDDFKLPSKIYGDQSIVNRWLKSWETNSEKNLGILLAGTKGSGKTITAQKFCIDSQLPVIIINEMFHGSDFIDFVTSPKLGKCIIFLDEFEKTYSKQECQYELLSVMDGNYATNLVFLLTVNEDKLNDYLVNRLNRIKYCKNYHDLETEVVDEVIDDMLVNKNHRQSIHNFFDKVNLRTFDLLVNLIKEMNLFNEDALQCGSHLNLKAHTKLYDVYEIFNNKEHPCYSARFYPGQEYIEIERRTLEYIPEANGVKDDVIPSFEEDPLAYELGETQSYNPIRTWSVRLEIAACKVTKTGNVYIIEDTSTGLKFRLSESKFNFSLVF